MTDDQLYALYLDAWARNTNRGHMGVTSPPCNDTAEARFAVALGTRDSQYGDISIKTRSTVLGFIREYTRS